MTRLRMGKNKPQKCWKEYRQTRWRRDGESCSKALLAFLRACRQGSVARRLGGAR
jgi:hypothetical protein